MIRARDGIVAAERWIRAAVNSSVQFGKIMIEVTGSHIGIAISPTGAHVADIEHSRADDEFVMGLMRSVAVTKELSYLPEENGILMAEGSADAGLRSIAPLAMVLHGTGEIYARLSIGYRTKFSLESHLTSVEY